MGGKGRVTSAVADENFTHLADSNLACQMGRWSNGRKSLPVYVNSLGTFYFLLDKSPKCRFDFRRIAGPTNVSNIILDAGTIDQLLQFC